MASTETCVHGQPIDGLCIGTCEHGILCGQTCQKCARIYAADLRRLLAAAGDGDVERGRSRLVQGLVNMMEQEADHDE